MNTEYEKIEKDIQAYSISKHSLDEKILYFLSEKVKNIIFDKTMPVLSTANNYGCVYIIIALLTMLTSKQVNTGIYIIIAMTLGSILGEGIIKHIIKRCRPISNYKYSFLIKVPPSYSFPSGHTTSSFAVLGVLWSLNSNYKYWALILAVLISFSRIYLHVHYPSDIIAGIILGLICSKLTFMVLSKLPSKHFIISYIYFYIYKFGKVVFS